jgi:hypothetical protein
MLHEREDFLAEHSPDFVDDGDEDEIMAELRRIRREMLVEFPTHEALFHAMKAHEAEEIRQGRPVTSLPPRRPENDKPVA